MINLPLQTTQKNLLLILVTAFFLFLFLAASAQASWQFNGTISRPQGAALEITIEIDITAEFTDGSPSIRMPFTLPSGATELPYSFQDPMLEMGGTFVISFAVTNNSFYLAPIYYNTPAAAWSPEKALSFTVTSNTVLNNIDITLVEKQTVSGILETADQTVFSENKQLKVNLHGPGEIYGTTTVLLPAGQYSVAYSVDYAAGISDGALEYEWIDPTPPSFYPWGYYSDIGTLHETAVIIPENIGTYLTDILIILTTYPNDITIISGTISLPPGMTSNQDLRFRIEMNENCAYQSTSCKMSGGATTTKYILDIPKTCPEAKIYYAIDNLDEHDDNPGNLPIYWRGYYASSGTQYLYENIEIIDTSTNQANVDITMLQGTKLEGELLPPGSTFDSDILIYLTATAFMEGTSLSSSTRIDVVAGQSSIPWTLIVPPDLCGVTIKYFSYDMPGNLLPTGYYSNTGTMGTSSQATSFCTYSDSTDMDMTLLVGYILSSTIQLPAGVLLNTDIEVSVSAYDQNNNGWSDRATISANNQTGNYSIKIPTDVPAVKIDYYIQNSDLYDFAPANLLRSGNYSQVADYDNNEYLQITGDTANLDLPLQTGTVFSGTVTLPAGITLTSDLQVQIWAENTEGDWRRYHLEYVTIKVDEQSSQWTFPLHAGWQQTRIAYFISNPPSNSIADYGYFHHSQTVSLPSEAEVLSTLTDQSNIDMTILQPYTFGGTVTTPGSRTFAEDITGAVICNNHNGFFLGIASFTIPASQTSGSWSLDVAGNNDQVMFEYQISSPPATDLLGRGFFNSSGTGSRPSDSELIHIEAELTDIDLSIITGTVFSGSLIIPGGETFSNSTIPYIGYQFADSDLGGYLYKFNWPALTNTLPFSFAVPAGSGSVKISQYIGVSEVYKVKEFYRFPSPDHRTCAADQASQFDPAMARFGLNMILHNSVADINCDSTLDLQDTILSLQIMTNTPVTGSVYNSVDLSSEQKIGMEEAVYIMQNISEN